jgi:RNA polymerase sigma-70 factor, ECF subfamily
VSIVAPAGLDSESAEWVRVLSAAGPEHDAAVVRLHAALLGVARAELRRRAARSGLAGPELDDLAYQAAADCVVAVVAKIGQFRGESRFITWAYRFVIFDVATKLGRHFWREPRAAMESEDWEGLPDRLGFDAARQAEWRDLITALRRAVDEELTPHQRRIFVEIVLRDVPLDALVVKLGSNRNAIYKSLFDARRKLRRALAANGYMDDARAERP